MAEGRGRSTPTAMCPLRAEQTCNLCHPDAYVGPQDCPTVAMVMDDPLLRELWREQRAEFRAAHAAD